MHIRSGEVKTRSILGQLVFQRLHGNVAILMDTDSKHPSAFLTWEVDLDCGVEVYQSTKNARRDMLKNLCIITKA